MRKQILKEEIPWLRNEGCPGVSHWTIREDNSHEGLGASTLAGSGADVPRQARVLMAGVPALCYNPLGKPFTFHKSQKS